MSYMDIIVTAAYPDMIETIDGAGRKTYYNGLWHYEVAVVASDLEPEDFQRFVRDGPVFRVSIDTSITNDD